MLSPKQEQILLNPLNKINLYSGVTGSGKSYVANILFYEYILTKKGKYILTGDTLDTLYKNVISELLEIDTGNDDLTYTRNPAQIRCSNGSIVFCFGVNDERAQKKIKGGNIDLWYSDEVTLHPESAFNMLFSRCRGVDPSTGKLHRTPCILTCNPDIPTHYIKLRIIAQADIDPDITYYAFGFKDNPTITEEYIQKEQNNYSGAFYQRMILGKWIGDTEKLVIPEFATEQKNKLIQDNPRPRYYDIYGALDPGFSDFTGYVLGYYDWLQGKYIIEAETMLRRQNTERLAHAIRKLEKEHFEGKDVYCRVSDTSSQVICDLQELHGISITATRKDDKDAQINYLRLLFQNDKILINPRCVHLIRQCRTAMWKDNRKDWEKNDQDGHMDLLAALIYFVRNVDKYKNPYPVLMPEITEDTHFIKEDFKHAANNGNVSELQKLFG